MTDFKSEKDRAIQWLRTSKNINKISPLGGNVAYLLDKLQGLHNINRTSLSKVDWANDYYI